MFFITNYRGKIIEISYNSVKQDVLKTALSHFDRALTHPLWGEYCFHTPFIENLILKDEAFLWYHVFFEDLSHKLSNPVFFFNAPNNNIDGKEGLIEENTNCVSIRDYFIETVKYKYNFLDFVQLFHEMAEVDNIEYEPFQKSMFNEVFVFLINKEMFISKAMLLACCKKYTAFELLPTSIEAICEYYSHKYSINIIPRRQGKTMACTNIIAARLLSKKPIKIGYFSHTKFLATSVYQQVMVLIKKWNRNSTIKVTPPDSIAVKHENNKDLDDGLELTFRRHSSADSYKVENETSAIFKGTRSDNQLRGPTIEMLFIDEFIAIPEERYIAIFGHGQKTDNKTLLLSSPIGHKPKKVPYFKKMFNNNKDINFLHVYYFCDKHIQYAMTESACPNLMFFKPDHITMDPTNKLLTNTFSNSSTGYEDELGIFQTGDIYDDIFNQSESRCPFSDQFLSYLTSSEIRIISANNIEKVYIYVDPSYNCSLSSGIGLCASGSLNNREMVILYIDHKFLSDSELGSAVSINCCIIMNCINYLSSKYCSNEKRKQKFYVAIENNSSQDTCAQIYHCLIDAVTTKKDVRYELFLHYHLSITCSVRGGRKITKQLPGYLMSNNKESVCKFVIKKINEKFLTLSNRLSSENIVGKTLATNKEIDYLATCFKQFTYNSGTKQFTGKRKYVADDLTIATIFSLYFVLLTQHSYMSATNDRWVHVNEKSSSLAVFPMNMINKH